MPNFINDQLRDLKILTIYNNHKEIFPLGDKVEIFCTYQKLIEIFSYLFKTEMIF